MEMEIKPITSVNPKTFWSPELRKKAEEVLDLADDVVARCYFPGVIIGSEKEMREKVLAWRNKLAQLLSEVEKYG